MRWKMVGDNRNFALWSRAVRERNQGAKDLIEKMNVEAMKVAQTSKAIVDDN